MPLTGKIRRPKSQIYSELGELRRSKCVLLNFTFDFNHKSGRLKWMALYQRTPRALFLCAATRSLLWSG